MGKCESFEELKQACKNFVEASKNRGVYEGLKKLLTELYPDKAHFIYELLQNAEDQQADEVHFEVHKDKFIFRHNGKKRDFNLEDIDSITNIGNSTKKDDPTSIGKFGVGFKAVYAYTNTPEIHSGKYNFKIIDMLIPEDANVEQTSVTGETEFIFPFDNPSKMPSVAVNEIESTLNALDETAILFLRYIKSIKFKLLNGFEGEIFITPNISNIKYLYSITIKTTDETRETLWAKFDNKCPIFVDGKKNDYIVSMSYKIKKEDGKYSVDSNLEGKVCIYFPTDQKSQLRFHINAPFASTVARDNIQYCKENEKLLDALADLAVASLYDLKKHKLLDFNAYEALPTERDFMNAPNSRYKIILKKITEEFENAELFITDSDNYCAKKDVFKAANKEIKNIMPNEYLEKLYQRSWIPTVPSVTRIEFFIDQFKIEQYSIEDFIDSLEKDSRFFDELLSKQQDIEYFKSLYYQLSQSKERNRYYIFDSPRNEILENVKFIFCEDKKLHSVKELLYLRTDYHPKYYLKNPLYVDLSWKKSGQDQEIRNFLLSVGIKEMCESIDMEAGLSNDNDIERVLYVWLDILKRFEEDSDSIVEYKELKICLARKPNDSEIVGARAVDCCWSQEISFFYKDKFIFAEDCYNDIKECLPKIKEIFVKLGGNIEPKIVQTLLDDDYPLFSLLKSERERYDTCVKIDYGIAEFDWNKLKKIKINSLQKEALILWRLVLRYNNPKFLHIVYRPNLSTKEQNHLESSLVYYLKRVPWVPTKSGDYKCPYELTNDDLLEEFKYEKKSSLLAAISERPNNDVVEQLKNKGIKDENTLFFASCDFDEQTLAREYIEKLRSQKCTTGKSLSELASTSNRNQYPEDDEDYFDTSHKLKNVDKRRIKLEKEFDDRDAPLIPSKKLQFVLERPNTEEKVFVRNEYQSRCQICRNEGILTAKGKRYFEAINIFNTGKLDDSLQINFDLGWNTLCLCPNCAAKFKYSQLTISGLLEQVESIDLKNGGSGFIEIPITLENKPVTISFTPKHLLTLQVAIKKIKEIENNDIE